MFIDACLGTAVAAVNKDDKIRVFWQAQNGDIQESVCDGGWKYAPSGTPAGGKKLGTPIAACSEDLNRVIIPLVGLFFQF